jgi:uncharacterized protein YbaR (Trm112 family)
MLDEGSLETFPCPRCRRDLSLVELKVNEDDGVGYTEGFWCAWCEIAWDGGDHIIHGASVVHLDDDD